MQTGTSQTSVFFEETVTLCIGRKCRNGVFKSFLERLLWILEVSVTFKYQRMKVSDDDGSSMTLVCLQRQ